MPQVLFPPASLDGLVDDVLIQVLQTSSVSTILSLRQTSKRYYFLTGLRCIWYAKFCTEVLARNLPIPGPSHSLSVLHSEELEYRTLRALYLQRKWPRLSPQVHAASSRKSDPVDQVVLIQGGAQVLTVHANRVVCWDIGGGSGDSVSPGVRRIAEWSSPGEGMCKIFKDSGGSDVIAVGPRHEENGFATVLSLGSKLPFRSLCEYSRVPGVVAGITDHLLLVDTTAEQDGGGLELLDWHAQTTGTVLLPCVPDLFGTFVGYVLFSQHILVAWECAISVFPVPSVPVHGQGVIEHVRVFMFQEPISRPIAFSTCVARGPSDAAVPSYPASQEAPLSITIAARPKTKPARVSMSMLIPHISNDLTDTCPFPYGLARLSTFVPGILGDREHGYAAQSCTDICFGPAGRGLCVIGQEMRLCTPSLLIMPPCEMQFGPAFETGKPIYELDGDGDSMVSGEKVDFDEGMGRFVVAKANGGFEVVQLM